MAARPQPGVLYRVDDDPGVRRGGDLERYGYQRTALEDHVRFGSQQRSTWISTSKSPSAALYYGLRDENIRDKTLLVIRPDDGNRGHDVSGRLPDQRAHNFADASEEVVFDSCIPAQCIVDRVPLSELLDELDIDEGDARDMAQSLGVRDFREAMEGYYQVEGRMDELYATGRPVHSSTAGDGGYDEPSYDWADPPDGAESPVYRVGGFTVLDDEPDDTYENDYENEVAHTGGLWMVDDDQDPAANGPYDDEPSYVGHIGGFYIVDEQPAEALSAGRSYGDQDSEDDEGEESEVNSGSHDDGYGSYEVVEEHVDQSDAAAAAADGAEEGGGDPEYDYGGNDGDAYGAADDGGYSDGYGWGSEGGDSDWSA
ncbi:unnamed protein product [Vitrella brassicaformis CCMP3155]|uniref:Uncharacterized protein n=2 Tax=Vitrella brassicaformis TaxID=1169539 RepID=A0A0G4EEF5_VITBC|nr:unnamed protein product [Vitrella brassicaformis CCMP3155]|eukprot:CEL94373.1 unnamed protein product [Vitrella brassicaformis CCMP3155]